MTDPDLDRLARAAYSGCCCGHPATERPVVAWEALGERERAMWRDVAQAVLEEETRMTAEQMGEIARLQLRERRPADD